MDKWILEIPKWKGEMVFDYPMVSFIMLILLIVAGYVLCFMGYKYLQNLCLIVLVCLIGIAGLQIGDTMTDKALLKMCFFVMFTFLGACLLYFISMMVSYLLRKAGLREKVVRKQYMVSAPLGALTMAGTIYAGVYRSIAVAVILFVIFTVIGIIWGKKHAAKRNIFFTYDDLYERKPIEAEGEDA